MEKYIGMKIVEAEKIDDYSEGHYNVIYEDSYKSKSPVNVFENAYFPVNKLPFAYALYAVQTGKAVGMRLPNWLEDVVIKLQTPHENSDMTHPYLYAESRFGCVPWKETVVEMFSQNWQLVF